MIAVWMIYASAVGGLLWGAASLAERVARELGGTTRWIWSTAMVGSVLLPVALALRLEAGVAARSVGATGGVAPNPGVLLPSVSGLAAAPGWLDPAAGILWALGSLAVATVVLRAGLALRALERGWRRDTFSGAPILVSEAVGPAVVGVLTGRIVVPEWAFDLDEESRRLLIRHEREHIREGDHRLLGVAVLALVALPWSPALWLQMRRLREAVEMDCDARVLRTGLDRPRYGALLLSVAERMARPPVRDFGLAAAAPPLERRIRRLTGRYTRMGIGGMLAAGGLAGLILLSLPRLPAPALDLSPILPERARSESSIAGGRRATASARPVLLNAHEAPAILDHAYPKGSRAAGVGGTVVVLAYVAPGGTLRETAVQESSGHPELDAAAEAAVRRFRFRAGRTNGRETGMWVPQSVTFAPGGGYGGGGADGDAGEPGRHAAPGEPTASGSMRLAIWTSPARRGGPS